MRTGYVTAEEIVVFAISDRSLYDTRLKYGQKRAPQERWRSHVSNRVWRLYKGVVRGNPLIMTTDLQKAADDLRAYYLAHATDVNSSAH